MWICGRKTRDLSRERFPRAAAVVAVSVASLTCGPPVVSNLPASGKVQLEIYVDSSRLSQYTSFQLTWAGSWLAGAAEGGGTEASDVEDLTVQALSQQLQLVTFSVSPELRAGTWEFAILAEGSTGSGSEPFVDHLCHQEVYQDKVLIIRVTDGGPGGAVTCSSPMGGLPGGS